jgi:hypothetical protein
MVGGQGLEGFCRLWGQDDLVPHSGHNIARFGISSIRPQRSNAHAQQRRRAPAAESVLLGGQSRRSRFKGDPKPVGFGDREV